jgi:hypothetical protein
MTLPRTVHRREARKRAREREIERQRRWDAMTPEQQQAHLDHMNAMARMWVPLMERRLALANFVNRQYDTEFRAGETFTVNIRNAERR